MRTWAHTDNRAESPGRAGTAARLHTTPLSARSPAGSRERVSHGDDADVCLLAGLAPRPPAVHLRNGQQELQDGAVYPLPALAPRGADRALPAPAPPGAAARDPGPPARPRADPGDRAPRLAHGPLSPAAVGDAGPAPGQARRLVRAQGGLGPPRRLDPPPAPGGAAGPPPRVPRRWCPCRWTAGAARAGPPRAASR